MTIQEQLKLACSSVYEVSSTNTTDRHDITEKFLKVTWDTINQTNPMVMKDVHFVITAY